MTLADFATLSTAISGIAVPVSLIYLAIQTRQNSRHTRALIQQGASARSTAIALANQDPEMCAAWIEGNRGVATPAEVRRLQLHLLCTTAVVSMEDLYSQHCDGLLTAEQFGRGCAYFRSSLLSQPGLRAHWTAIRDDLASVAPRFCAFVDGLCVGEATEYAPPLA